MSEKTNSLDYYLSLDYPIRIYGSADEGYIASIDELLGCDGYGDTPAGALADLDDFKRAWFQDALKKGRRIPRPTKRAANLPSGRFNLRLPRSLHRALIDNASIEGISLNSFVSSLLSWSISARNIYNTNSELSSTCGLLATQINRLSNLKILPDEIRNTWLDSKISQLNGFPEAA